MTRTPRSTNPALASRPAARSHYSGAAFVDGRTWASRRARALYDAYREQLGYPKDTAQLAHIRAVAELGVIVEMRRTAVLSNPEATDSAVLALTRLEALHARRMRRLNLDAPRTEPKLTLAEHLAKRGRKV